MARNFVAASSQYIECGDIDALDGIQKFTICMWSKKDLSKKIIIGEGSDGTHRIYLRHDINGRMWANIGNGADTWAYSSIYTVTTFTHWAMVFDGTLSGDSNRLKGFKDGSNIGLTYGGGSIPSSTPDDSAPFRIGRGAEDVASWYSDGDIAEVMIFAAALTQSEISEVYTGSVPAARESDLIGYWRLGVGDPEPDCSGNGNSGTLYNSPAFATHPSLSNPYICVGDTIPQRKCKLTIQGSKVPSSQTDLIIRLNKDNLPEEMYDADSGNAAQNGGGDIRLTTDEEGLSLIPLHIRVFATDNNPALAVVDMATKVSVTGSNQDIWLWYKTTASDVQPDVDAAGGSEDVYSICYAALPMDETSGDLLDYSANGSDCEVNGDLPTQTTGDVSRYAQEFDGAGDFADWDTNRLSGSAESIVVFSAFVKAASTDFFPLFASNNLSEAGDFQFDFDPNTDEITMYVEGNDPAEVVTTPTLVQDTWYHVVMRYYRTGASSGEVEIYLNGASIGSETSWTDMVQLRLQDIIQLGLNGTEYFDGDMDEVLVISENKGDDYWSAYYESWKNPSTFIVEGTPEPVEPAVGNPYYAYMQQQ